MNIRQRGLGSLLVLLFPWVVQAQIDKELSPSGFGIFNNKQEYIEFIGSAKKIAYGPNGSKEMQDMIPLLNDIALNKPIGSTAGTYKSQASTLGMLSDKSIRNEIEMVDEQYEELKSVNARIQARVANEIRGLDFSKTATVTTRIKGIRDRATKELESLLLPHQVKRLRQLHLQSSLRRQSLVDLLIQDPLKSELELSEKQATELKAEEEKIEQDLQQKIRQLRAEAREKLLAKLKPDQEQKAKELIGEAFEFLEESKEKKNFKDPKKKK